MLKNTEKNRNPWVVNLWDKNIRAPETIAIKRKTGWLFWINKNKEINKIVKRLYPKDLGVALEFSKIIIGVNV